MVRIPRWCRYVILGSIGLTLLVLIGWPAVRHVQKHNRTRLHAARTVDYSRDIKPILEARCYSCHGPTRHKAGLRLDTAGFIRKGGNSGAVIVARDGANSLLIARVLGAGDETRMPPAGEPLTPRQVALLKVWIDAGAPAPPNEELTNPSQNEHWAFRPPVLPPVPVIHDSDENLWGTFETCRPNPIDAFLAAARQKKGLRPNPPVSKGLLLRRVFIDLIGLPPTREQLHAFLADTSEDAYEKVVDRLLASPQYGERWGRHWMDIWRYSDPDGRKAKADIWWSNEYIWRWRDWIVKSLNQDKGYDQMILEMLAGDEIDPEDPETLAATGFLVRNWFKLNRTIWLNNTVEHTAKAFLGLTLNCARCHDHKFDPISQKEYYSFRAIFQAHDIRTTGIPVESAEQCIAVAHAYDAHPEEPTWILRRGDEKNPDKSTVIKPGVPAVLCPPGKADLHIEPLPVSLDGIERLSTGRRLALARWLCNRQNPLTARVAVNHVWARHFGRPLVENVNDFGVRTKPPVQQPLLDWLAVQFMTHNWSLKWLHRLFVTSAAYRMESFPHSQGQPGNETGRQTRAAADPDNQYYWRMNPRRMEAEVVRDALLYLSGAIDWTMGGPPLDCLAGPDSPRRSLYYRYSREDKMEFLTAFDAAAVEECYRRQESIVPQQALALENSDFVWHQARRIARSLECSVGADFQCAPQAGSGTETRAFVGAAFEHILGRAPEPAEFEACEHFLAQQERLLAEPSRLTRFPPQPPKPSPPDPMRVPGLPLEFGVTRPLASVPPAENPRQQARECLVHSLINHNDFITIR
jgi:hypothetical protein